MNRLTKIWMMVVFGVVMPCVLGSAALGQPWTGSGTEGDPYLIEDAIDMQAIGANSVYWNAHFKLMVDIDLSAYTGTSFNIIGIYSNNPFTGVFDGNGYTISNFTYTSTGTNYIGLFRYIRSPAEIKDLGLINPNVDAGAGRWVGALVAKSRGEGASIRNCYSSGSVSGGENVGGLVGNNTQGGAISNCYSTASVSGTTNVGGLLGKNDGSWANTVMNCYSQGSVSGDDNVGGLVGSNEAAVIHCYSTGSVSGTGSYIGGLVGWGVPVCVSFWDTQTSGQSTSGGGTPKTTAEMKTVSTFFGWGGCGSEGVWVHDEGNDYPRLWWENSPGQPLPTENLSDFVAGAGTEQEPYLIETGEQMNMVGVFWCEWNKHFKLMVDIDLSAYTGMSFNIIGNSDEKAFRGVFDGNGHTISNFSYVSNNTNYIGLFGRGGGIRDLGLINPNVDGGIGNYVGSLVGIGGVTGCYVEGGSVSGNNIVGGLVGKGSLVNCTSSGSVSGNEAVGGLVGRGSIITNCYSTASVSGTTGVGGLVGSGTGIWNGPSRITNCYSAGIVSGVGEVGGLAGRNEAVANGTAEVTNCYSTASVTGYWYVGGLVGRNVEQAGFLGVASVTNCYSAGGVSGFSDVGGLVGYNEGGEVTDSFWDTETSDQPTSAGGVGMPTELMQSAFIFTAAGWDFVGESANGTDDIWQLCIDGLDYPRLVWQFGTADFVYPGRVDNYDLFILINDWLTDNSRCCDISPAPTPDGIVNLLDFAEFSRHWLEGSP